jgi:predicted DNA-binding transcriptional regulator YafY
MRNGLAMKRSGRMFAIIVDLQARRIQHADDLAARYEASVRTIYRDISARRTIFSGRSRWEWTKLRHC